MFTLDDFIFTLHYIKIPTAIKCETYQRKIKSLSNIYNALKM